MMNDVDRKALALKLGLFGVVSRWDELCGSPWIETLLELESKERQHRSFVRRNAEAKLGVFKSVVDFDWKWPSRVDRASIDDVLSCAFIHDSVNVIFVGPNGTGKTMLAKNVAHNALLRGYSALFVTASDMLNDLAVQESATARQRRLKRYLQHDVLCVDEVGYLSYNTQHADLLFEVVSRRYQSTRPRPMVLTTNRPFSEWNQVFPNASCLVTLIDRLVHRAEIVSIDGESYRLREAQERAAKREVSRPVSRRRADAKGARELPFLETASSK